MRLRARTVAVTSAVAVGSLGLVGAVAPGAAYAARGGHLRHVARVLFLAGAIWGPQWRPIVEPIAGADSGRPADEIALRGSRDRRRMLWVTERIDGLAPGMHTAITSDLAELHTALDAITHQHGSLR